MISRQQNKVVEGGLTILCSIARPVNDIEIVHKEVDTVIQDGYTEVVVIWDEMMEVSLKTA